MTEEEQRAIRIFKRIYPNGCWNDQAEYIKDRFRIRALEEKAAELPK
jgi:hypothetical protein